MLGMAMITYFYFLFIFDAFHFTRASFIFHENTSVKFVSNAKDNYFGYSTLLTPDGLFVGAPKALNEFSNNSTTGLIYFCSLKKLNTNETILCDRIQKGKRFGNKKKLYIQNHELKEDSWFGSSLAIINDKLLITAPRVRNLSEHDNGDLSLLRGACYIVMKNRWRPMEPLRDDNKHRYQMASLNGTRSVFGKNNTNTYYYSVGQFAFSMAVTKRNTLIFGAPGLLESAGAIISYTFDPDNRDLPTYLQPITNPYGTMDLEPDDNFGYSVDSGTFEINGSVLYVGGAPRAEMGRGKVLVIASEDFDLKEVKSSELESNKPLDIRAKLMGPHAGSYFGASICCTDINGDGRDDLLVGAPTFAKKDGNLTYDQGAVFIYMTKETESGFVLEASGYVSGTDVDGARFGTAIADLGDVNGDMFRDIAIGAPWENNGTGAVYIYMGCENGLKTENVQRIQPSDARGFGWSISKGVDVDSNSCNDVVIGAYDSAAAYLYRCIPTMHVRASIRVPNNNKVNLPVNVTTFTAMFCVSSPPIAPVVSLKLKGRIKADPMGNRTTIIGDSVYPINVTPGNEICNEKTFRVNKTADFFKPIELMFDLEADELMKDNSTIFLPYAARLSNDSTVNVSLPVEIINDCGDDSVCTPWLNISLEALNNPYVPGTSNKLGIRLTTWNLNEPAYGLKMIFTMPLLPKRIPSECTFDSYKMFCDLPQPFKENEIIVWDVELEYDLNTSSPIILTVKAELNDTYDRSNITAKSINEVTIDITPESIFIISGKVKPNETITITRSSLAAGANISFQHHFVITNKGPSDWNDLRAEIWIPEKTFLAADIAGCELYRSVYLCQWSIPAKISYPVSLSLQMDLSLQGNYLRRYLKHNATSSIYLQANQTKVEPTFIGCNVTTTLILEPADLLWCIVVPCIFLGFLVLAVIIRILHKCGFFLRAQRQRIKTLEICNQHSYRTIQTSDTDQSSQPDRDEQHLDNEENPVIVSPATDTSSYHVLNNT